MKSRALNKKTLKIFTEFHDELIHKACLNYNTKIFSYQNTLIIVAKVFNLVCLYDFWMSGFRRSHNTNAELSSHPVSVFFLSEKCSYQVNLAIV